MSQRRISLSDDLVRLRDDGYELRWIADHLVIEHVPYVTSAKEVAYGRLVSTLDLVGEVTVKPTQHEAHFAGEAPCDANGDPLGLINSSEHRVLATGLEVDHMFSQKPAGGYEDYHQKMSTYVSLLERHARAIDPEATARTFPVYEDDEEDPRFVYNDTASTRAQITAYAEKLRQQRIAIVGLGGTGSYVLDLIAKTHVKEIHLWDGDRFVQHNAFRAPGAASVDRLQQVPQKVNYMAETYSEMKLGITAHDCRLDASNVHELEGMDFVFICIDDGPSRQLIAERLEACGVPFIDTGLGVYYGEAGLAGLVRTTVSTPDYRDAKTRLPFETAAPDDYERNIQVADLNALNAAIAVIRWKKRFEFYSSIPGESEHQSIYAIFDNEITNENLA
jgi:molybdopterin/thiamine biosynthesis adenylyltransferase